jgi:hypothetical protein
MIYRLRETHVIAKKKETKKKSLVPELYHHPIKKGGRRQNKGREMRDGGMYISLVAITVPLWVPSHLSSFIFVVLCYHYFKS